MMINPSAVFGDYVQYNSSNKVSLGKPHYYPSEQKELDDASKKIGFYQQYIDSSGQNKETAYSITADKDERRLSDDEKSQKKDLDYLMSYIEESSGGSKYDESLPDTPSATSANVGLEVRKNMKKVESKEHSVEEFIEKHDEHQGREGTLSKFIQRFRQQPPLPRKERYLQRENDLDEFWWLSSPPPENSSTPKSSSVSDLTYLPNSVSSVMSGNVSAFSIHGDEKLKATSPSGYNSDSATARIQQRANRLLELSDNTTRDSSMSSVKKAALPRYVDGACNKLSNGYSTSDGLCINRNYFDESKGGKDQLKGSKAVKPEDDILYKWRLSRKLEMAAQAVTGKNPFLNHHKNGINIDGNVTEVNEYVLGGGLKKQFIDNDIQNESCRDKSRPVTTMNKKLNVTEDVFHGNSDPEKGSLGSQRGNINELCKTVEKHTIDICRKCKQSSAYNLEGHTHQSKEMGKCNTISTCKTEHHIEYKCKECCCLHRHLHSHPIPPHIHDICDMIPCVHMEPTNRSSHQSPSKKEHDSHSLSVFGIENQISKDNQTQLNENYNLSLSEHRHDPLPLEEVKSEQTKRADGVKNDVSPVIAEVVSKNLFGENCDRFDATNNLEKDSSHIHSSLRRSAKADSRIFRSEVSSSEDEFPDDEILQELRSRRKNNKEELQTVCDQLRKLEE